MSGSGGGLAGDRWYWGSFNTNQVVITSQYQRSQQGIFSDKLFLIIYWIYGFLLDGFKRMKTHSAVVTAV